MRAAVFFNLVVLAACTSTQPQTLTPDSGAPNDAGENDAGPVNVTPVTSASPKGESHVGALTVTLTSVPAATITYTIDGSDPTTSSTALSGASPLAVTLDAPAQVTLTFFGTGATGLKETAHSEQYTLLEDLLPVSIEGRLFAPQALAAGAATVLLFDVDPVHTMNPSPIGTATVSPADTRGAEYHFEGLAQGTYWVAALWSPEAGMAPQAFALAVRNPIALTAAGSRADSVDVYVGQCDPAGTGVDGNIIVSADLQSDNTSVTAYAEAVTLSTLGGSPLAAAGTIGTGMTRSYALCGLPAQNIYLDATATGTGGGLVASVSSPANPINASSVQHVNVYLGGQDPSLGSISGTIQLNGPFPGGTLHVIAGTGVASVGDQSLVAFVSIPGTTSTSYSYTVPSMPSGTYTLSLQLASSDGLSAFNTESTTVTVALPSTPNPTLALTGSVGRIEGTATVTNEPNGHDILIGATPAGSSTSAANTTSMLGPTGPGNRSASYALFGLPDGSYNLYVVVDVTDTGDYATAVNNGAVGASTTMATVTNGGTTSFDFSVALQTP
jgi:hypothetical protein